MTSEGLGEMFEGDTADMCAGKFPLVSMGGRAEGLACADPGARTPIGASGNFAGYQKGLGAIRETSNPWQMKRRMADTQKNDDSGHSSLGSDKASREHRVRRHSTSSRRQNVFY